MKKTALLLFSIGVLPMAALAAPLYSLDMTQDDTGDFRLAQIGNTFGGEGSQANQNVIYNATDDVYQLTGRYNQDRTLVLTVPLDTPPTPGDPDGYISGDVALSMTFEYVNDAGNSDVVVSLRQNVGNTDKGAGSNTYPNYYVRILDNSTFELRKFTAFNDTTLLDSLSITPASGSSVYSLNFSALDNGANVDLSAELFEGSTSRGSLSFTDTSGVLAGGYVGIGAGQGSVNNGTFEGIEISSMVVTIPEPSTLALSLISLLAGYGFLRKRLH